MSFCSEVQTETQESKKYNSTPTEKQHNEPHSENSTSDAPDGGLVAWIQVAGAFFLFFNTWSDQEHST